MKSNIRISAWMLVVPLLAVAALLVASCSSNGPDTTSSPSPTAISVLSVGDAWVKATDGPMTGAFAVITNNTDQEMTVVSATTSVSDKAELHETADSVMRVKPGGFDVPANADLALQPGGSHIMIMNLKEPIKAGDEVQVTLNLANGETVTFQAQAKESAAGDEPYHEDTGDMSSFAASMSMG